MPDKMVEVEKGRAISSRKYGRDFTEGEIVDVSYLSDEEFAALLASGAVKETRKQTMTKATPEQIEEAKEAKKAEVKNA